MYFICHVYSGLVVSRGLNSCIFTIEIVLFL